MVKYNNNYDRFIKRQQRQKLHLNNQKLTRNTSEQNNNRFKQQFELEYKQQQELNRFKI